MAVTRGRRGTIEVQTNWLFVLIAGAIILIVVFGFITKQRSAAQIKAADTLIKYIEAITVGTTAFQAGAQKITLPKSNIKFECTEECTCTINIGPVSKDFKDQRIFAPASLGGLQGIFWTKAWEVPFRAGNFLYITDQTTKYYFIYSNDADSARLKERIEQRLPEGISHEFIDMQTQELGDVGNKGFKKNKFVFLNAPISTNLDRSFGKTASFISITASQIEFRDATGTHTVSYIGEAEMFGAIFAGYQMYSCNLEKAKARLGFVIELYRERAKMLNQLASEQSLICGYDDIIAELEAFLADKNIGIHYDKIRGMNEDKLHKSCPLIY